MKKIKRIVFAVAAAALLLAGCGGTEAEKTAADTEEAPDTGMDGETGGETMQVEKVIVNTTVRKTGQYPESFTLVLPEGADAASLGVSPEDFSMTGNAGMWGSEDTREFSASFESADADGNTLSLVPKDFPEKYFYVKDFSVRCEKEPALSFTEKEVSEVITPVADEFETFTKEEGAEFDYHLFTPSEQENKPVVVVFHGYGDTNNLLTYRTAVEWAEPENQAIRPCYVIAPVIDDATYYSARGTVFAPLKKLLDQMIREGKADPEQIYLMGNSFGGMSSIEFAEQYPEVPAGILALCPALTYSNAAVANLEKIKEIPIWFAHAEHDGTIPVDASRNASDKLRELGAKEVHFTEYTDEEMNAAGADSAPDSTYSYHHVELAVMEDDAYMDWLYSLRKSGGAEE